MKTEKRYYCFLTRIKKIFTSESKVLVNKNGFQLNTFQMVSHKIVKVLKEVGSSIFEMQDLLAIFQSSWCSIN